MKKQIIIIFLFVTIIGLTIIAIFEIRKQTQQESITLQKEITEWLIYTDSKYGYSIKYPNTWYLRKDGDIVSIENTKKPLYWDTGVGPKDPNAVAEEGYSVKIIVHNNKNSLPLAEYLKSIFPGGGIDDLGKQKIGNFVMQQTVINGLEAVEAHEEDAWNYFSPNYFLVHGSYIYEIGCGDKSEGLNGLQDIAKQILQSFSFTK